jgi:hypothetical protein
MKQKFLICFCVNINRLEKVVSVHDLDLSSLRKIEMLNNVCPEKELCLESSRWLLLLYIAGLWHIAVGVYIYRVDC